LRGEGEWFAGLHIGFRRRPQGLQPVGLCVLGGQYRKHTRRRPRFHCADAPDPRMRMR